MHVAATRVGVWSTRCYNRSFGLTISLLIPLASCQFALPIDFPRQFPSPTHLQHWHVKLISSSSRRAARQSATSGSRAHARQTQPRQLTHVVPQLADIQHDIQHVALPPRAHQLTSSCRAHCVLLAKSSSLCARPPARVLERTTSPAPSLPPSSSPPRGVEHREALSSQTSSTMPWPTVLNTLDVPAVSQAPPPAVPVARLRSQRPRIHPHSALHSLTRRRAFVDVMDGVRSKSIIQAAESIQGDIGRGGSSKADNVGGVWDTRDAREQFKRRVDRSRFPPQPSTNVYNQLPALASCPLVTTTYVRIAVPRARIRGSMYGYGRRRRPTGHATPLATYFEHAGSAPSKAKYAGTENQRAR
ncbi:hypothetical protein SCHPADRAFT_947016 [Schizopora paradoxa]|uniref:Uncharacterized protein n=1 Tax=Schizopora paradoxa TaxID=27342 RepID=A0A0H2R1W7_9AGAM|nr:hypothetical protein SCHPADRAFT_947016 [Schizopora paradoxa]